MNPVAFYRLCRIQSALGARTGELSSEDATGTRTPVFVFTLDLQGLPVYRGAANRVQISDTDVERHIERLHPSFNF